MRQDALPPRQMRQEDARCIATSTNASRRRAMHCHLDKCVKKTRDALPPRQMRQEVARCVATSTNASRRRAMRCHLDKCVKKTRDALPPRQMRQDASPPLFVKPIRSVFVTQIMILVTSETLQMSGTYV
jgi:hypothetical protein